MANPCMGRLEALIAAKVEAERGSWDIARRELADALDRRPDELGNQEQLQRKLTPEAKDGEWETTLEVVTLRTLQCSLGR